MIRSSAERFGHVRDWMTGHTEPDLPRVRPSMWGAWKWLVDEWSIQVELGLGRMRIPDGDFRRRMRGELSEARQLFADRGWLESPRSYHQDPPPLREVRHSPALVGTIEYDHVRFDSDWEPWPGEPGHDRWMDYRPVRTGHAWLLRHDDDQPRPWIVLVNGYRTGDPTLDMAMFRAGHLHYRLGLNVVAVVLPLHGPRSIGVAGSRVLYAGAMNTVFTVAQGAWDVRRVMGWLRETFGATDVGITGISLGGYMASLVAALDEDLSCVIAGVPEADLARGIRRQAEGLLPPYYEQWGLSWDSLEQVFGVVSPMSLPCLVPHDNRYIYAGLLDRWVRPGNVKDLWEHWERPEILWYEGSHLSFPFEPTVRRFVDDALASSFELPGRLTPT